jgi:hypothetical protein
MMGMSHEVQGVHMHVALLFPRASALLLLRFAAFGVDWLN